MRRALAVHTRHPEVLPLAGRRGGRGAWAVVGAGFRQVAAVAHKRPFPPARAPLPNCPQTDYCNEATWPCRTGLRCRKNFPYCSTDLTTP